MPSDPNPALDREELLHLALRSIEQDELESALEYLKRILTVRPDDAEALYLMGGVHAEIGLFGRALEEMTQAVEIEPELDIAHFQRGMLFVRQADYEGALAAWTPLERLGEDAHLLLFARGITRIMESRPREGLIDLEKGIALNVDNPPLNDDMIRLKAATEQELERVEGSEVETPATVTDVAAGRQALISRYQAEDGELG